MQGITFLEIPVPVVLNVIPHRQVSFVYPPYMQLGSNYHAAMPNHFSSNMQMLPYSLPAFRPYNCPFSSNQQAYMPSFPLPPVSNVYSETITKPMQPYSNEMVTQLTVPRENDGVETTVEIKHDKVNHDVWGGCNTFTHLSLLADTENQQQYKF